MNFKLIGKCVIAPCETKANTTWNLLIFSLTYMCCELKAVASTKDNTELN